MVVALGVMWILDGGVEVAIVGALSGALDAVQQIAAWTIIFFVASAAASGAYLTVGEGFPLEAVAPPLSAVEH